MISITKWILMMLLAVLVSSCGSGAIIDSTKDRMFTNLYPDCEMNSKVQFLSPKGEFKSGVLVSLDIRNNSEDSIIFPNSQNVKILYFDSNEREWLEIENKLQYVESKDSFTILKPANAGLGSYTVVLIIPVLSNTVSTNVRVAVSGNVYRGSQNATDCVGAFIDITILP